MIVMLLQKYKPDLNVSYLLGTAASWGTQLDISDYQMGVLYSLPVSTSSVDPPVLLWLFPEYQPNAH